MERTLWQEVEDRGSRPSFTLELMPNLGLAIYYLGLCLPTCEMG